MKRKVLLITFVLLFALTQGVIAAESEHVTRTIIVDKTAPLQPTLAVIPKGWVNTDITVTVQNIVDPESNGVSAGVDRVEYSVKGDVKTHSGSEQFTISVTSEGENQIMAETVDNVGNISTEVSGIVRIDKTNPLITLNGVEERKIYYNSITPTFSATDSGSSLASCSATLTKDAGAPASFASGTEINQPGSYNLTVTATDNAGNKETASVNFNINAPVSPSQPIATAMGPQSIKIDWPAVEGATGYLVKDGAVQIADVKTGVSYTHEGLSPNSLYHYTIMAYNPMGNSPASPETAVYTLANDVSNLQVTGKTSTNLTVSLEANENPVGTEYSVSISDGAGYVNDVPFAADMLTYEITGLCLGKDYTVTVKARNGDVRETTGMNITAATNKAPVLEIATPLPDAAYSDVEGHRIINVSGTVTDDDNDNVTVTATINGVSKSAVVNNCAGGKPFALDFDVAADSIPEGPHTVTVIADDGK